MDKQVNWEEFFKGIKYFGKDRMSFFVQEPEALELLRTAPEEIRRKVFLKCRKVGVAWPESVPVDMSAISDQDELFDDDEPDKSAPPAQEPKVEPVRFVCNRFPNFSMPVGKKTAQFKGGRLVADDPEIIAAVRGSRRFEVFIFEG